MIDPSARVFEVFLIVSQSLVYTNNCAHSATTIGTASASGITSKHRAWNPSLLDLPYKFCKFYALAHEPGRISDPAKALLDSPINRLSPGDRPRSRAYCYQLIAATTAPSCHRSTSRIVFQLKVTKVEFPMSSAIRKRHRFKSYRQKSKVKRNK